MPIPVTCGQCRSKFRAPDELAGRKVKCPKCQAPVVVPEPLPLDDDPSPPAAAPNPFDFDAPADRPRRRSSRADDEAAPPGTKHWTAVASGTGGIQVGLIMLAVAASVIVFAPRLIDLRRGGLDSFTLLLNLLAGSLLLVALSAGVMGFGHISASSAPDPRANTFAGVSLILNMLSVLLWMGFLGIVVYLRVRVEELIRRADTLLTLAKSALGCLVGAGLCGMGAELLFLSALIRAANLLRSPRLYVWSLVLFIALAIYLAAYTLTLLVFLFGLERDADFLRRLTAPGGGEPSASQILGYVLTVGFIGAYFYTLQLAKWVLRNPVAVREEAEERDRDDDDDDYRGRRR